MALKYLDIKNSSGVAGETGFNRIEPFPIVGGDPGRVETVRFELCDRVERRLKDDAGLRADDSRWPVVTTNAHRRDRDVGLGPQAAVLKRQKIRVRWWWSFKFFLLWRFQFEYSGSL